MLTQMVKVRLCALGKTVSVSEASACRQQHLGFVPLGLPGGYATRQGIFYLWHLVPSWHAVLKSQGVATEDFVPQLVQLKKDFLMNNSDDGEELP